MTRALKKFVEWEDEEGLLIPPEKYWNFFDWSYELNQHSLNGQQTSLMNYFYLMAMRHVVRLSREIGIEVELSWMEERIRRLPALIAARFGQRDRGMIADTVELRSTGGRFSQLAHALALLTESCPPEFVATAERPPAGRQRHEVQREARERHPRSGWLAGKGTLAFQIPAAQFQ
ncbi:MAG: hypothetical protein J0L75_04910 [Spirochaetes bacterium]|nr:hypothetical protein [Spirochaetota bacterium]